MEEKPEATHLLKKNKHIYINKQIYINIYINKQIYSQLCCDFVALKSVYISRFRFRFLLLEHLVTSVFLHILICQCIFCTFCDTQNDIIEGSVLLECDSVALSFSRRFEGTHCLPSSRVERHSKVFEDDSNTFPRNISKDGWTTLDRILWDLKLVTNCFWVLHRGIYVNYWQSTWLTDWLAGCLTDWLTGWLTDWLTDFLTGWLTDWVTDWLTDWMADWLTDELTSQTTN